MKSNDVRRRAETLSPRARFSSSPLSSSPLSNSVAPRSPSADLCANLHADDGPDSPLLGRREDGKRGGSSVDRKTLQLCAQVRRALHGVVSSSAQGLPDGLVVESVDPDPDASRLRVVIGVASSCAEPVPTLKRRLADHAGRLRCEVAQQISRKRAPLLTFELRPRKEAP